MDVKRYRKDRLIIIYQTLIEKENTKKINRYHLTILTYLITKDLKESFYNFIITNISIFSFELNRAFKSLNRDLQEKKIYLPKYRQEELRKSLKKYLNQTSKRLLAYVKPPKVNREKVIVTIGFESRDIDQVISSLVLNQVKLVIDTRLNPHASKYGFDNYVLRMFLGRYRIAYVHFLSLSNAAFWNQKKREAYEKLLSVVRHNIAILDYPKDPKDTAREILALNLKRDLKLNIKNL